MKAISYISVFVLLTTISCTSGLYTGVEYDDIYFQASDRQLVAARTQAKRQIIENDLRSSEYYDNIYAADTLMSEEYYDAVGYYDDAVNNKGGTTIYNNYYDNYYDYSYASRLNRFYGNYFYPYWRDPFYYYPSISFSFGYPYYYSSYYYSPYYYSPFYYDPFYYDPFYYGYSGFYGSYYRPYRYYPYYSYYSPYYYGGGWSYYPGISDVSNSVVYGRRERQSNLSTRYNERLMPTSASSTVRREENLSKGSASDVSVRSSDIRRSDLPSSAARQNTRTSTSVNSAQDAARNSTTTTERRTSTNTTINRPEYNSVNRSYTPSYSNPRMSERPSYNNSRVNSNTRSNSDNRINSAAPARSNSNSNRGSTSISVERSRPSPTPAYRNSGSSYSVPSRESVQRSSGFSSGSGSSSRSSSSYSRGSSSGGGGYSVMPSSRSSSGSSGFSGSSGSSGSSRSSGGSSSSGGRR